MVMIQGKKILVVEDERPMRQALFDKLSRAGFQVLEAADGEAGLKMCFEHRPDLVLLDIYMPKMVGTELFQRLRQDEWGKTVPVIILSNLLADDATIQQLSQFNLVAYLVKSGTKIEYVVERIIEVLSPKA
jgi:DNA-binding response OmpR family regulator